MADPVITPAPTADEAVAILAAIEASWPRPVAIVEPDEAPTLAWRFSGRWWHRDRMAASERPWR